MWMLQMFFLSFGITVIIEEIIGCLWGGPWREKLGVIFLVNVLTNPPLVLIRLILSMIMSAQNRMWVMICLELVAVFVEGSFYETRLKKMAHPMWFSLVANLCSFGTGVVWNMMK